MRDLGCCAQNIKGTSMKGFRMLTKFWQCHYGSWKLRRPAAHGKATKVIWKKTGPCDLGDSMAHWEWSGLVYQRTWFDVCYICHIFYAPASQPVGIETWVHGKVLESPDRLGMQMSQLRAFDWFCSMQVWIPVHKPQHVDLSLSSLAPCERCSQKHLIWLTYILLSRSFRGAFATTVFAFAGQWTCCVGECTFAAHVFWGSFAKLFRELSRPAIFSSRRQ
jgi:hypothetical protein